MVKTRAEVPAGLYDALADLAGQIESGPNEARLETVVDGQTNRVLIELAEYLGGGNGKRSAAARVLLREGAKSLLAQWRAKA